MSKRVPIQRHNRAGALAFFTVALLLSTFASGIVLAARPTISIERTQNSIPGSFEFVDINYEANGADLQFAGFDLLISYDAAALTLISASQGNLLTDCGWQYFTYRVGNGACTGNCPSGVIRIVAVGDSPQVEGPPSCNLGAMAGKLATIKFLVTNSAFYHCEDLPVQFFWADCGDNLLSSVSGSTLFVADTVFYGITASDYYPTPAGLSTNQGWPDSCFPPPGGANEPVRALNFHHGNVSIACPNPVNNRGDINLNGLAYEVSDAVVFANYFLYGLAAFTINISAQVAATDINANGAPLEYRDIIYLLRIITGDAQPFPKPAVVDTFTAVFTQSTESKTVRVESPHTLAGAIFGFSGEIVPQFLPAAPGNYFKSSVSANGGTTILIAGSEPGQGPDNIWFSYTGEGTLVSVTTADFADSPIDAQIVVESTPLACGDVNGDENINISDAVFLINYVFGGGPAPFGGSSGDVDCNGIITVSDAVYLVMYIFAGGPTPCANCP